MSSNLPNSQSQKMKEPGWNLVLSDSRAPSLSTAPGWGRDLTHEWQLGRKPSYPDY